MRGRRGWAVLPLLAFALQLHMPMVCSTASNFGNSSSARAHACPEHASYRFCDKSLPIDTRVKDLVSRLSLPRKISQLVNGAAGIPELEIPPYEWWNEGLHGVATSPGVSWDGVSKSATSFPMPIALAAAFNETLWNQIGQVISTEARALHNLGQSGLTFWSPVINILRDPRWGRAQETPGEDPFLSGQYAIHFVRGMQEGGDSMAEGSSKQEGPELGPFALKTSACCKHFTAYDLDNWNGTDRFHFDALVTKQDLVDTYNPPFQSCVREGRASSLMCSYNKLNGIPTCADPNLLTGLIRQTWGFQGYIVSDCDALSTMVEMARYYETPEDAVAGTLLAGLDLNCGATMLGHTSSAISRGLVTEANIDAALTNSLTVLMRLGIFDGSPEDQPYGRLGAQDVCSEEHRSLALEAAVQGIVLLKNDGRSLPLSRSAIKSLAVIGPNANDSAGAMLGNYKGPPCEYITPLRGLSSYGSGRVMYAAGCETTTCESAELNVEDAMELASEADAVVLVVGLSQEQERETLDRRSLLLPGQQEALIESVASVARGPVVLVIMSAGPVDVSFAKSNPQIQSILWLGYPGQAGGRALAQMIFGDRSPGGRLPMTWYPESLTQWPMTNMNMRPDPSTGYPGRTYRFYTGPTIYKFGDGLAYSNFSRAIVRGPSEVRSPSSHEQACYHNEEFQGSTECRESDLHVCINNIGPMVVSIQNEGSVAAVEVMLVYHVPAGAGGVHGEPLRKLVGFKRVMVQPFATEVIELTIDLCKHASVVKTDGTRSLESGLHRLVLHTGEEFRFEVTAPLLR